MDHRLAIQSVPHVPQKFPNSKVKEIAIKYIQINAFFAHPENVHLGMFSDDDLDVRNLAVNHIMRISTDEALSDDDFEGGRFN